jgi:hypothetical protein
MSEDEVRREILHAIVECEIEGAGDPQPAVNTIGLAKEIRDAVFVALKNKGMLSVDHNP